MSKDLVLQMGQFDEIISIIDNARTRALKAVNAELIQSIGALVNTCPLSVPTLDLATR